MNSHLPPSKSPGIVSGQNNSVPSKFRRFVDWYFGPEDPPEVRALQAENRRELLKVTLFLLGATTGIVGLFRACDDSEEKKTP